MSALLSVLARVGTMAISLVCGVLSARLVIGSAGVEAYALMTMLIALPSMLTFSDLGSGAVVVNSVSTARDVRRDLELTQQVRTVARVILGFAMVIAAVSSTLLVTGAWTHVLGGAAAVHNAALGAWACSMVYCATTALGLWQRILLGLGKNPLIVLIQGIVSPLSLLLVWALLNLGGQRVDAFLAVGTFAAMLCVAVVGTVLADRYTAPLLRRLAREVLAPKRYPGTKVMHVGWPMLAQMLSAPVAMVVPRYVLAQSATPAELAQYALAGQVFFAIQALIATAGVSLWPTFNQARASGRLNAGPVQISLLFGTGATIATLVVLGIGPWFFGIVSDHQVEVPSDVILAFGVMTISMALVYPLGMFLMDPPGIRFQVVPSLAMALATVVITIISAPALGVTAPLLAYGASMVVFEIVPYLVYIRRHRARLYGTSG